MSFTNETKSALSAKLDPSCVRQRKQGSFSLDYIEGWHAIAEANRIFGYDGWSSETIAMDVVRPVELVDGKFRVGYLAKVRVVAGGIIREGTGYGSGIAKDAGDAIESAIKEAETDARKRALMTFGNPFGLALYDKTRANVGAPERRQEAKSKSTSAYQLKKDGRWEAAMRELKTAIDLGPEALQVADRIIQKQMDDDGWPDHWREHYNEALERAWSQVRSAA